MQVCCVARGPLLTAAAAAMLPATHPRALRPVCAAAAGARGVAAWHLLPRPAQPGADATRHAAHRTRRRRHAAPREHLITKAPGAAAVGASVWQLPADERQRRRRRCGRRWCERCWWRRRQCAPVCGGCVGWRGAAGGVGGAKQQQQGGRGRRAGAALVQQVRLVGPLGHGWPAPGRNACLLPTDGFMLLTASCCCTGASLTCRCR